MNYQAIAQAYHQNGFEIVKGFFSVEELRRVETEVQRDLVESPRRVLCDASRGVSYLCRVSNQNE